MPLPAETYSYVKYLPLIFVRALWIKVHGDFPICMPPIVRRSKDNIIEARL